MSFEDLESWQKARLLVRNLYEMTRDEILCRDFGICDQLQRAAVSVMSNLAEGFERSQLAEKLQFYNFARGSTAEIRSLLYVVEDNFPKCKSASVDLRRRVIDIGKMISGLIRSTERRKISA